MEMTLLKPTVGTTVLFGAAALLAQTSGPPKLTGTVSDAMCGATHAMKGMNDADCTRMCIKSGQKYALVVGKTTYILSGHEADLEKYTVQKVSLTGVVKDGAVTVQSVTPTK